MVTFTAFHGTSLRFKKFDNSFARIKDDLWGGGVAYFTDDKEVAKTYATSAAKKKGEPLIYECTVTIKRTFDVDDTFTGKELVQFFTPAEVEAFARGARIMNVTTDRLKVLRELREGAMTLTGDQVFRGMSNGMINTAKARQKLEKLGYDGLRYNGGVNMNMARKHNVYIAYEARNIKINKYYAVSKDGKIYEAWDS